MSVEATRASDTGIVHRPRTGIRLAVAAALALAVVVVFLTVDVHGYWEYVLPRRVDKLAAMILTAYAVSVSTVLFQTITSNRILTPALMGFDSLYVLLQTALTVLLTSSRLNALDSQLRFVLETVLLVALGTLLFHWLFLKRQLSLHLVLLVGIVLGTVFRSVSSFLQRLMDPSDFVVLQDMFFASFNSVDRRLLILATILVSVVSIAIVRLLPTFDVLALGREPAINLGVNYRRVVTGVLAIIAVFISVSTALVGPITFFGLLVANLAYVLTGTHRHVFTLPMATMSGIVTLVGGQLVLERILDFNTSLSVVVEFLGGIVFLTILIRSSRAGVRL